MKARKSGRSGRPTQQSDDQARPLSDDVRALLLPSGSGRPRRQASQRAPPQALPDPFEGLVTPQQAAELFDVTTRTIRNWRKDGLLKPVLRPRGRIFYRLEDLLQLFEPAKPADRKSVKLK
jgi:hypothetical protein